MIFGYFTIAEIISHEQAFSRHDLRSKRMHGRIPNGNIIVQAGGRYNRFDLCVHRHKFDRIKHRYAIGSAAASRMLTADQISRLAPCFLPTLQSIIGVRGERPIDIISRKGRELTARQVKELIQWVAQ